MSAPVASTQGEREARRTSRLRGGTYARGGSGAVSGQWTSSVHVRRALEGLVGAGERGAHPPFLARIKAAREDIGAFR